MKIKLGTIQITEAELRALKIRYKLKTAADVRAFVSAYAADEIQTCIDNANAYNAEAQ